MSENPFEVLGASPNAGMAGAVRQAALLTSKSADEEAKNRYRRAIQTLTQSEEDWQLWCLLTHSGSLVLPEIEQLMQMHRRAPGGVGTQLLPELDVAEFAELVCPILARELEVQERPFERLPIVESAEEIRRQSAEALWLALPIEMRG